MNVRGDFLNFPHSTNTTALICKSRKENPQKLPQLSNFIAGRPKAAFMFWFFGDFSVACCYLWLLSLYINIKIGKIVVKC